MVVGTTSDPDGVGSTVWVRKLDPAGAELWLATFRGEAEEGAEAGGVAIGPGGDLVVVGPSARAVRWRPG